MTQFSSPVVQGQRLLWLDAHDHDFTLGGRERWKRPLNLLTGTKQAYRAYSLQSTPKPEEQSRLMLRISQTSVQPNIHYLSLANQSGKCQRHFFSLVAEIRAPPKFRHDNRFTATHDECTFNSFPCVRKNGRSHDV